MADWKAIYDRVEDMELERIRALVARKEAEEQEKAQANGQPQQTPLQDGEKQ